MTFRATSATLKDGYDAIKRTFTTYRSQWLPSWNTSLTANVDAFFILMIKANIDRELPGLDANAGLSGMAAYAQAQENLPGYNVATEYATARAALIAIRDWIIANIPANAITIVNGVQVPNPSPPEAPLGVYSPARTVQLKALLLAAYATIE